MLLSVAVKDVCIKARKIKNLDPNRLYVVAYIGSIFFSYDKGNKSEGCGLGLQSWRP